MSWRGRGSHHGSRVSGGGKLKARAWAVGWGNLEGGELERPGRASCHASTGPFQSVSQTLQRRTDLAFQGASRQP